MSAPDATKGRFRAILERLDYWIEDALGDADYDEYYVTNNYNNWPTSLSYMPYVTVKLDPVLVRDETYGRKLPSDGSMSTFTFTLHVFHEKSRDPSENENRDAHIAARTIMDYLRGRDQNATEMSTHYIVRVFDISARESEPIGLKALSRMIVKGRIQVKRLDSP